jgi:16S rRNA U516 pseudouridylate synthase RsuA-like enzyme
MPQTYHIRTTMEYADALLKHLRNEGAIEDIQNKKDNKKQLNSKNSKATLEDSSNTTIPESQKKYVRSLVKKYQKHPELLVSEKDALKIIG